MEGQRREEEGNGTLNFKETQKHVDILAQNVAQNVSPADPRACAVAEQDLCGHALRTAGAAGRRRRLVCRRPAAALSRQHP